MKRNRQLPETELPLHQIKLGLEGEIMGRTQLMDS